MRCWLLTQQVAFGMELNSAIQRHRRELSAVLKCRWLGQAGVGNRSQGRLKRDSYAAAPPLSIRVVI